MRQSLLIARQDLHSLEQAGEEQKLTEEIARLREHKEHQKATDTMQLKTILMELDEERSRTRKLESENSDLGDRIKELRSSLELLKTQNQDLEIGDTFMKNEIKMLKTLNGESSIEVQQLQEMVKELQSRTKDKLNESSINMSFSLPENLGDVLATDFQSKENEYLKQLKEKDNMKEILESQVKELEQQSAQASSRNEKVLQEEKKKAEEVQKKYNASKAIMMDKVAENKKLKATVEELKKKLCTQGQPIKQTSMSPPPLANNVFKAPKNTPGRCKPGRTQSGIQINAPSRRPPKGTGNLFTMDDEQGEMFSNSYLSELKSGKCSMDNSGKMFGLHAVSTYKGLRRLQTSLSQKLSRILNSHVPKFCLILWQFHCKYLNCYCAFVSKD